MAPKLYHNTTYARLYMHHSHYVPLSIVQNASSSFGGDGYTILNNSKK